ncbi:MAG TPA: nucleoside monophosphate kinase [Candidatus Limnocylindrales bacterium]|jgi:adenylate kinase|nr:nucleoside monophosphate kinase [Candidatus Limnocylindrales bacterium]
MKYRTILMFGAPGSGKGTHGRNLGVIPGFFHCACGDVFRNLRPDSPLGKVFLEHSSQGELVPDQPTIELWRQYIETSTKIGRFHPGEDTLVLDGIPRSVPQAEMLSDTLDVVAMFYLTSSRENLVARMQRRAMKDNRLDDANLDVIRQRLKTYEKETKPVINFYGKKLVHRINTDQPPVKTFLDILKQVVKL